MDYKLQYRQLLTDGRTISRNNIKPRNLYRIQTYSGGDPNSAERYVFVIGVVDDKIHCLKLNEILPKDFISFLNKIIDKRKPIGPVTTLNEIVKKFNKGGSDLFEQYVKKDTNVYSKNVKSYRIYNQDKISTVSEVFFEPTLLEEFFDIKNNETLRNVDVEKEIDERDG